MKFPATEYLQMKTAAVDGVFRVRHMPHAGAGVLGGLGALAGGAIGAMVPSRDENGETHRMRNALIGAGIGGAAGAAGGWHTGAGLRDDAVKGLGIVSANDKAVRDLLPADLKDTYLAQFPQLTDLQAVIDAGRGTVAPGTKFTLRG